MNKVIMIGRLTRDIELRYTSDNTAVASFTLAVDRIGKDKTADFPRVVVFGKQAENCERYIEKGARVAIDGRLQTGSYEKSDGTKVYTTDIVAERVEFIDFKQSRPSDNASAERTTQPPQFEDITYTDEDLPF